jgi:ABC-type branched-subunit amino acid transport system substrate-binding protein
VSSFSQHRTNLIARFAAVLLLAGCSGGGIEAGEASRKGRPAEAQAPASPEASNQDQRSGRSRSRTTARGGGGSTNTASQGSSIPPIFTSSEDRIGITPTTINLCVHTPKALLPLVGVTSPEDFGVFWDMANADGGVHGRTVLLSYEDDQNTVQGTNGAMARCRERDPFSVISGTVAVEILDAARAWAERNHTLYYFNYSSESPRRTYSYSPFISLDRAGRFAAQWILREHSGLRVGLVRRQDPSYDSGAESFRRTLNARGADTNVTVATSFNQGSYRDQILALKGAADVVFVLDDPLGSTALIQQSGQQGYKPQWVLLFAANVTTDTLRSDAASKPALEALTLWPPYKPGAYDGPYARYGGEIRQFEDAFRAYRGRSPTSDAPWIFWAWWRVMAQQFEQCGRDCSRNRFLSVVRWDADPFCSMEFTSGSNFAGNRVTIARAYSDSLGSAAWEEIPETLCRDSF